MAATKSKRGRKPSTPAKEVPNAVAGNKAVVKKRHAKKRSNTSFSVYIYKVLKQVHPDTGNLFDFFIKKFFRNVIKGYVDYEFVRK